MTAEESNGNVATAMNGSVDALENANYIPQNILVTGGAGTYRVLKFYHTSGTSMWCWMPLQL